MVSAARDVQKTEFNYLSDGKQRLLPVTLELGSFGALQTPFRAPGLLPGPDVRLMWAEVVSHTRTHP